MAKRRKSAKRSEKGGGNKIIALLILGLLVPFSLPTVVVLFFSMLPTAVAWGTERGTNKYAWLCVGGLNFAGVIPYLFSLWFGVHTLDEAFRMISDGGVLLVSYATSALGWLMYLAMPPMVSRYLDFSSARRVSALKAAQKKLIEEWGEEVINKAPEDVFQKPRPEGEMPKAKAEGE